MLEEHEGRLFPPEQFLFTREGLGLASLFFANRNIPVPPSIHGSRPTAIPGAEIAAVRGTGILPTCDADHESKTSSAQQLCRLRRGGGARDLRRIGHAPGRSAVRPANGVLPVQTHRAGTLPDEGRSARRRSALRATGRTKLPPEVDGACPMLEHHSGRCLIYADRPFGCRTHFCAAAGGPLARR